jgi:hypothetical protein
MSVRFVSVALAVGLCCGCQSRQDKPGIDAGGPSGRCGWIASPQTPGVPGLDSGDCYYVGKLLLVWAAGHGGGGGGTSTSGVDGIKGTGSVTLSNGRSVDYSFQIPDNRSGTIQFGDAVYDLTGGRVFLVRLKNDSIVVKQVDLDLTAIDLPTADFAAVGRADPVVRAFFEERVGK